MNELQRLSVHVFIYKSLHRMAKQANEHGGPPSRELEEALESQFNLLA